ncbi:MAG: thiamine pyrophosphate-dependent enzyme [Acidobacteriia bacterium]|nr:thiamine pyrophosphate-dependent enzyme [Terriglobia bacterium]
MSLDALIDQESDAKRTAIAKQVIFIGNGNDAAAKAIVDIGYDGEGYYPITPSSEVGEVVSKAIAEGSADMSFVVGTSELAAISVVAGMAIAGGRAVDVTSSQGLMLKAEQMPAISGMGLPVVLNLATRDINAPLNIKNGHSDLMATLGWGWLIFCAPNVQSVYDLNLIALRVAEAVNLPALVAYDGFHTSHANRRILVLQNREDVQAFVGSKPSRVTVLDVDHPRTFGPYMNDDLINTKVQLDEKFKKAYDLIPSVFEEFHELTGRLYQFAEIYGHPEAEAALFILNSAGEAAKVSVDKLLAEGKKVKVILPTVLRPWPEEEMRRAIGSTPRVVVAERASQYGAGNYLANELGATLQRVGRKNLLISRTYGVGGLNFRGEDGIELLNLGLNYPNVNEDERKLRGYYGAWPGDPNYDPPQVFTPLTTEETTFNQEGSKIDFKHLSQMPARVGKHSACPGCGIFTNLNLFLRGIDGQVVFLFNTGCGMVVTTGYPFTSFKTPYVHNLFHNGASTATGIVEMYQRFRAQGKIKEEITFIVVSGDGGDDIGMDQVIGAALRNDPFIMLEYDNKGYMNTGGQLCYTGFKGERFTNAPVGNLGRGKKQHSKDIIEILRGTHAPYLFTAAESNARDMIAKARKAQAAVRSGNFVFGKIFSVCPLNWGSDESKGNEIVDRAVKSCLFPLYEIEHGITKLNYDPEKSGRKIPVQKALEIMGTAFSHMAKEDFAPILQETQEETDRRWQRLKELDTNPKL